MAGGSTDGAMSSAGAWSSVADGATSAGGALASPPSGSAVSGAAAFTASPTSGAVVSPDTLARAHDGLLKQGDLQFDFPAWQPPPPPPDWLRPLADLIRAIAPIFPYIFYGGLILGGAAILFFLLREFLGIRLPSFRRKAKGIELQDDWRPSEARARTLLEDADRLAAQGRYGEAVHLLLFRSIEDMDERWPNLVHPALTSRDIAAHRGLPEGARTTFGDIARVVERSFFGGHELAADDFDFCRGAYERFALPGVMA